jgi:hypothetical protein
MWTLMFTLKLNFYGPITKQGLIKFAKVDFFSDADLQNKLQTYTVQAKDGETSGNVTSFIENFEDF